VSKKKDPRTDEHEDPTAAMGGPLCPAPGQRQGQGQGQGQGQYSTTHLRKDSS
jgi:hypothetical protein